MPPTDAPTAPETTIAHTMLYVRRTVKIGEGDEADKDGAAETSSIEVHRFPDGVKPALAKAGLSIRKSQQTPSEDWVAGEVHIGVERPCYAEELPEALVEAYRLVKTQMGIDLPKMLAALSQLSK